MANFEYRTFLLPHLLVRLGAFGGVQPDRDRLGNDFMAGEIAPDNANQLVSTIHQTAVLLNLAGYQLEAVALAAVDNSRSAGILINLVKGEYTTYTASSSASQNALQYLIGLDFPEGDDLCLGLRLTPRPMWWGASAQEQYYTLRVPLDDVNVVEEALNMTEPSWLLLGGVAEGFPSVVGIHHVLTSFTTILTDLKTAIASALAEEWVSKPLDQRGGLLKYLNPGNWGDPIGGSGKVCEEETEEDEEETEEDDSADDLSSHHAVIFAAACEVYKWLESIDQVLFQKWLLEAQTGSFERTLQVTKASPHSIAAIETAIETVFIGTHSLRDWIKYQHMWNILAMLDQSIDSNMYIYVLMLLEELTVIDMLGRVRQTDSTVKATLPFDITGHYEQVIPPESGEGDTNTYDFHTLQINQAGVYAQGHWQEREPAHCSDKYNGGRYLRFKHYRFCLDVLPQQPYEAGLTEICMRIYRWVNANFISAKPYLKLPADSAAEAYCNKEASEIGTIRITKIDMLPMDAIEPDPSVFQVNIPDYGVELEIDIGTEDKPILLRRLHPLPYVAQPALIAARGDGRERLVIAQRFPLHSLDKVRILAAANYLVAGLEAHHAAFSTLSYIDDIDDLDTQKAIEQIDRDFAEWMARYACVNLTSNATPTSPQLEQIQYFIVQLLAQRKVLDDENLEALTLLSVFLQRPIHATLMPYTRKILGSALPPRTPEMEEAVNNNTAGLHVYKWGTSGLGEEGQAAGWDLLINLGIKGITNIGRVLDVLGQFVKNASPISPEVAIFFLGIEKLTPFSTAYPEWAPGQIHSYIGFQVGLSVLPPFPKGIYLNSDSTQLMYSPENWNPGNFSGQIITFALNAGLVIDIYEPLPFKRVDVNKWVASLLQNWTPVEMLCEWMGIDPQNIKLGASLSATIFMGNVADLRLRWPIVSKGLTWVDYSLAVGWPTAMAYVLEATAVTGSIFHIPVWISKSQAKQEVTDEVLTPIEPLEWGVIKTSFSYQSYNEIKEWELKDDDKNALRQMVAEQLYSFRSRNTKLTITGHASPVGQEPYNLWLSQKRAQAVYDYIRSILTDEEYLILPQNTSVQGYGELYANILGASERDPSWQTVMVYVNGQLLLQIGETIRPESADFQETESR